MKIIVFGLWHLGTVTSVCVASNNHTVVATDDDDALVENFNNGNFPVKEPGMERLYSETKIMEI